MQLRQGADAILVGINTILADDPSLTWRRQATESSRRGLGVGKHRLRRIILDALARTPLDAKIMNDGQAALTTIVVSKFAPKTRVRELAKRAMILRAPLARSNENSVFRLKRSRLDVRGSKFISPAPPLTLDLRWLLRKLGAEEVTSLLVEGGGEVNASFLFKGLAHRIAFFYAPKLLGGRNARKAVAGAGARSLNESINLLAVHWRRLGADWLLTADVGQSGTHSTHSR